MCGHIRVGYNGSGKDAQEVFDGLELGITKLAKRPSRGSIVKGIVKGLVNNNSCISGRVFWHRAGSRKKLYRLKNVFCLSGRDVHLVALVVLDSAADLPAVNTMGGPRATVGRVFVY